MVYCETEFLLVDDDEELTLNDDERELTLVDDEGACVGAECVIKRNQHHGVSGTGQVGDDVLQERHRIHT